MTAKEHYERHLGNFYSWMAGDFAEKQQFQQKFFADNSVVPRFNKVAFDLGCGHGLQSVPLANLGFDVKSVDFNKQLLNELRENGKGLQIAGIESGLIDFLRETSFQAELIVCMGDTITHLETLQQAEEMISLSAHKLVTKGKLILSYRTFDSELFDEGRFIPVRSDDGHIHTCFIEYAKESVKVFDILHEKKDGEWKQHVSWYPKLRIPVSIVLSALSKNNFVVNLQQVMSGMTFIIAEKQ